MAVKQIGLWADTNKEVEVLVERVKKFNLNNLGTPVTVNIQPCEKGDEFVPTPHYKLSFEFEDKGVLEKFWTE